MGVDPGAEGLFLGRGGFGESSSTGLEPIRSRWCQDRKMGLSRSGHHRLGGREVSSHLVRTLIRMAFLFVPGWFLDPPMSDQIRVGLHPVFRFKEVTGD